MWLLWEVGVTVVQYWSVCHVKASTRCSSVGLESPIYHKVKETFCIYSHLYIKFISRFNKSQRKFTLVMGKKIRKGEVIAVSTETSQLASPSLSGSNGLWIEQSERWGCTYWLKHFQQQLIALEIKILLFLHLRCRAYYLAPAFQVCKLWRGQWVIRSPPVWEMAWAGYLMHLLCSVTEPYYLEQ